MITRFNTAKDALAFAHRHTTDDWPLTVIMGKVGVYWVVNSGSAKLLIGYGFEEVTD